MTGGDAHTGEKTRAGFAGIVLLLRQLAQQLLDNGNTVEARGIVDGIEAIQTKTQGNLEDNEAQFLQDILFELRMAVLKDRPAAEGDESDKPSDESDESDTPTDAENPEGTPESAEE